MSDVFFARQVTLLGYAWICEHHQDDKISSSIAIEAAAHSIIMFACTIIVD